MTGNTLHPRFGYYTVAISLILIELFLFSTPTVAIGIGATSTGKKNVSSAVGGIEVHSDESTKNEQGGYAPHLPYAATRPSR